MTNHRNGLSATEEARRLLSGVDPLARAAAGDNLFDKATKEASRLSLLAGGQSAGLTATQDAARLMASGFDPLSKLAEGGLIDNTARELVEKHRGIVDGVLGRSGILTDAVAKLESLRGVDSGTLASIKDHLHGYDAASEVLREELIKAQSHDLFNIADIERYEPPPLPRNPILKTNELLDEMVEGLGEQRGLIEATAEAQKQETELLGKLVEAFMTSQAASDKATRRAQMQAWIGIAIAVLTGLVPLIMVIFGRTGH